MASPTTYIGEQDLAQTKSRPGFTARAGAAWLWCEPLVLAAVAVLLLAVGAPRRAWSKEYDLYLLAGQSNMDGRGARSELPAADQQPIAEALIYYRNVPVSSQGWQPLAPGFSIPPGHKSGLPSGTFGPELGFAKAWLRGCPGRSLALIKGSKGGSSLRTDWNPGQPGDETSQGPRYRDFIETVRLATEALHEQGDQYTIRGLLWHQGESDANVPTDVHQERLLRFIERIREDLEVSDLPVLVGQVYDNGKRDKVRAAIEAVGTTGDSVHLISCTGLSTSDAGTHFDAASQLELGRRFAAVSVRLLKPE